MTNEEHLVRTLRLRHSVSRGRNTDGYNIVTLTEETSPMPFRRFPNARHRAMGGGYDMVGTVFGDWLEVNYPERLKLSGPSLVHPTGRLYGARIRSDGYIGLDGGCGLSAMIRVAEAIGLTVRETWTGSSAVRLTGFVVIGPGELRGGTTPGEDSSARDDA